MSDYDFNKESLRPNKVYGDINSPAINKKYNKATTQRSKSIQKLIVTSFSKKQITDRNINQQQFATSALKKQQNMDLNSPNYKKSQCQSEYYIKTAETKQEIDPLHFQDQIRVKESQLQILAVRLAKAEFQIKQLTTQNQLKTERIDSLEKQLSNLLTKTLKQIQNHQMGTDLTYQCEKYKQDQRRLLKMLEQTTQYLYFSKFASLDDGIKFLRHPNQIKKSDLDAINSKKPMHYCSCNKQYISQSSFWVPQKIYNFGREFIKQRSGQFTKSQYQLLLYELNKHWRERQKKIVNTLNGQKAREIQKIKRKRPSFTSLQKDPISR